MSRMPRLPRLPYVLLGAMTLVSFGGPFADPASSSAAAPAPTGRRTGPSSGSSSRVVLGLVDRALRRLRHDRLVVSPGRAAQGAVAAVELQLVTISRILSFVNRESTGR